MFSDHQEGLGGVMFRVIIRRASVHQQDPAGDHFKHYTTEALLMITLNITPPRPSW
jgi:hypothetical protein